MLKLPGRGKKSVMKPKVLSPYKQIFRKVKTSKETRAEIKKNVFRDEAKKTRGVLKLINVEKAFGKHSVLSKVNLEIKPGKIMGIIGVSGSGKTTILRLIIGFYKPSGGEIRFNDVNIKKQMTLIDRNFGFATQDNSFYGDLTVEENLKFFGKLYGLTNDFIISNLDGVLGLVELLDAKKILAKKLSGGMQRRLDIACSIIHDPTVLILDEPTEDLDPILRAEILRLIMRINKRGTTVIFTTHLLNEAELLCDEVAIIANGKIIEVGSPNDLKKSYHKGDKVHLVLESGDYSKYKKRLKSYTTFVENNRLIVYVPRKEKSARVLKRILGYVEKSNDNVVYADIRKPSLGEVFSNLTKNAKKSSKKN